MNNLEKSDIVRLEVFTIVGRIDLKNATYIKAFQDDTFNGSQDFVYMGTGEFGAKALGLALLREDLVDFCSRQTEVPICIDIPRTVVITTSYFDQFMKENRLIEKVLSETPDQTIIQHFQDSPLPEELRQSLRVMLKYNRLPLAVRASSLLENRLVSPFAGVYKSRMIPNNADGLDLRLEQLEEAVKYVYASAFLRESRIYLKSGCHDVTEEKMALIIQEVVGDLHQDRYYPNISGIACSYNFYPAGHARPQDGVVHLALGLGKAIVDGGPVWSYSPQYPEVNPPFKSMNEQLKQTQLDFWAIDMSRPLPDPRKVYLGEGYLKSLSLHEAETDHTLGYIASTYDYDSDKISIGIGFKGPRVVDFAPLLKVDLLPANQLIKSLLVFCEELFQAKVEIQFAITFDLDRTRDHLARFALLQVRTLDNPNQLIHLEEETWTRDSILTASSRVMGNGWVTCIKDIIYVDPDTFDLRNTRAMAQEVSELNRKLLNDESPYLLIGFGRWGTSDPWLGIPVDWDQISGARVIIESSTRDLHIEFSKGFHFFHHLCRLKILYFSVKEQDPYPVDWQWLQQQEVIDSKKYVTHVRLKRPLSIKVDGRNQQGVIFK